MSVYRRNAGKTDNSWIKQAIFKKAVSGQIFAYRSRFPEHRILLIDANSGDGVGVEKPQSDLFTGAVLSDSTAAILTKIAESTDADLCLCESMRKKRAVLMHAFPKAQVLSDHNDIPELIRIRDYKYALWISDPCGYAGHGVEAMKKVAQMCRKADFVIAVNMTALIRLWGTSPRDPYWAPHWKEYPVKTMHEPVWWREELNRKHVSCTNDIYQSSNFKHRVLVVSNYLTEASRRHPFKIITERLGK